jgi:NAD(P)-dependent dehydrogenase (short-subunit alcohol dehydrogenase family)
VIMKDRVILITGANEGIGFAIAKLCRSQGANVVLHGLDVGQLRASARELGPDVTYVGADLLEAGASEKIIDFVVEQNGRIDGLVNNAAALDRCTIETISPELLDRVIGVNLRAPVLLIQAAVAQMAKQKSGGNILNIGSINASCGAPTLLIYSASKGALETVTRNLGASLASRRVRVNQINVGWTVTENENRIQIAEGQPENWHELVPLNYKPSGALLSPGQVAQHAVFWLSDNSAPVTGQVCDVEQYPMIGQAFGSNWSDK